MKKRSNNMKVMVLGQEDIFVEQDPSELTEDQPLETTTVETDLTEEEQEAWDQEMVELKALNL